MTSVFTWTLGAAPTAAATGAFPYDHPTVEQTDTRDPAAWRAANQARFDRIYGPGNSGPWSDTYPTPLPDRIATARQWRIDHKPHFDAIYGP